MPHTLIDALHTDRPAADHADAMHLYAWLVGRWEMSGTVKLDNGSKYEARGEIHAGWVLQGRAIQDVWIFPGVFYGTTLRVYDPGLEAWHILWSDPLKQYYTRQVARAQGNDIVQHGTTTAGVAVRWRFIEIMPDSFHWRGERSTGGGDDWQLQAEFFARRTGT